MNIRKLYYWHRRFLFLKAWYFLVPAIIFVVFAVHGLRTNYSEMVRLRAAVYTADQQNGDVEGALQALRSHVYNHMNTNLVSGDNAIRPPIQLKARYERLNAGEIERVKKANDAVAADGERLCGAQYPASGFNAPRVACVQQYVADHAVKTQGVPDALYKFDFISPRWSPDLAGWSIVLSLTFIILFLARTGVEYVVRRRLKH